MTAPGPTMPNAAVRGRLLLVAEAVTLAHVARPLTLGRALTGEPWDIEFACAPGFQRLVEGESWPLHDLDSILPEQFMEALAKGNPVYDLATLKRYVEQDLELLDRTKPDLVLGDFRISLAVSARLAGIPYATLTNAYWSPYAHPYYHIPELPLTRALGPGIAGPLFRTVRPMVFALHTVPMNRLRKHHGLPSVGASLERVYTDADHTLYADLPELIPTFDLPSSHHYLGPINWSPDNPLPDWWDALPSDRPVVYVTLGSSGEGQRLKAILNGLASLPISVIAATAGKIQIDKPPANAFVTDFLPGDLAAARSTLVICNGGSPTTMQGLTAGVPVVGVCNNLDQYLNMAYLETAGVGTLLRSGQATPARITTAAQSLIDDSATRERARQIATSIAEKPSEQRFRDWLSGRQPRG